MSDVGGGALSLGSVIRAAASRCPDAVALRGDGRALGYRELVARIDRVAAIAREGLRLTPGARVALLLPNCLAYAELITGLTDASCVVATLNPGMTGSELTALFADFRPVLAIVEGEAMAAIVASVSDARVVRLDREYESLLARARDGFVRPAIDDRAPLAVSYTSGTTGTPKGVVLSHRSRTLTFLAAATEYRCFGADESFLAFTPLYHGAGLAYAFANLAFGGTTEIMRSFDIECVAARLGDAKDNGMFVVPTHLARFLDLPAQQRASLRGHALKAMICNATALEQPLKEAAIDAFGNDVLHETYGSTEAGIVTNNRPADQLRKPGSVGRAFPFTAIDLRDDTGASVADGAVGELFSRSPYLFESYLDRPDETREAQQSGWVTVGDLATRDADGYVSIVGRKKDMIISGGINVYPREIETYIASLPGIVEVAVVGRPDPEWGEAICAYVVARDGAPDAAAIVARCRTALSRHKLPRSISFVDRLPRNASGKLLKRELL